MYKNKNKQKDIFYCKHEAKKVRKLRHKLRERERKERHFESFFTLVNSLWICMAMLTVWDEKDNFVILLSKTAAVKKTAKWSQMKKAVKPCCLEGKISN